MPRAQYIYAPPNTRTLRGTPCAGGHVHLALPLTMGEVTTEPNSWATCRSSRHISFRKRSSVENVVDLVRSWRRLQSPSPYGGHCLEWLESFYGQVQPAGGQQPVSRGHAVKKALARRRRERDAEAGFAGLPALACGLSASHFTAVSRRRPESRRTATKRADAWSARGSS